MDIWSCLTEVAILIVVYRITAAESDVLESFRPKEDNPPELNDFLTNVLDHRGDFSYIREAARKYQKMKKDTAGLGLLDPLEQPMDFYTDFYDDYKADLKRHVPSHRGSKKFKTFKPSLNSRIQKPHRYRRGVVDQPSNEIYEDPDAEIYISKRFQEPIFLVPSHKPSFRRPIPSQIFVEPQEERIKKQIPEDVVIESEGETGELVVEDTKSGKQKKQAMNFETEPVHHAPQKHRKEEKVMSRNNQGDFYYVDLKDSAQKEKDRYNDRRRYGWVPRQQNYLYPQQGNRFLGRPSMGRPREESFDYPVYESEPHHNVNDEVAFERALSYEVEPRYQGPFNFNNNPAGNNLYSVDAGRPDNVAPLYSQEGFPTARLQNPDYAESMTNERFFIDADNNLKKIDNTFSSSAGAASTTSDTSSSTTSPSTEPTKENSGLKNVKQVGNGFIAISKARRDNIEDTHNFAGATPSSYKNSFRSPLAQEEEYGNNEKLSDFSQPVVKNVINEERKEVETPMRNLPRSLETEEDSLTEEDDPQIKNIPRPIKRQNTINEEIKESNGNLPESLETNTIANENFPRSIDSQNNADELSLLTKDSPDMKNEIDKQPSVESKENKLDGNVEKSSVLSKNSLHPLRVRDNLDKEEDEEQSFKVRKLQFVDEEMANVDNHDEYEDVPKRPRRDFLDALGMKNEEDYSEDNPYKDMITLNNTDINNDTTFQNFTVPASKCKSTTTKTTSTYHQKDEIKDIKQILEEPKEVTAQNTVGTFKKEKDKKRAKTKRHLDNEEFSEDAEDDNYEVRRARDTLTKAGDDVETKILLNKNRIYNYREDSRNRNFNDNQVQRAGRAMPKWPEDTDFKMYDNNLKSINTYDHRINKKEDIDNILNDLTTSSSTLITEFSTQSENNSSYEQIAQQMDTENEKLAQVANGHLATKIVSTVFDELRKKNSLRTKFYSGLSRKHVDFAGTIDFDIFKANESEDVGQAKLLLDQMTKVLNKLVITQVRRSLCQRLPSELKDYLETIINMKTTLETVNFVPNPNQGDFLFTYQEKLEPPFSVKKLQETLVELEGLLLSYNSLNEDCQNRAEPVKDYIERHVKMLKQMVNCPSHKCTNNSKRDTPSYKRLGSVGLGRSSEFEPNFEANQLGKSRIKYSSVKNDQKRDAKWRHSRKSNANKSDKYKKLERAAEKVRQKRENDRKIAELFGSKRKRSARKFDVDFEEPVVYSLG